jgi:hypothetical protein
LPSGVLIDPAASADTPDDTLGFNPNLQKNDRGLIEGTMQPNPIWLVQRVRAIDYTLDLFHTTNV